MKILVLNPFYMEGFVRTARSAGRSRGRVGRHPDYLAIATAVLEAARHEVKLLDASGLGIDFDRTMSMAQEFNPDLSVIHTTTPSIYNDIKHAEMLKDLGSTTVLIGQHASALPMETMQMSEKIDYIARGEYDYTLRDIADKKDPADVLGITYRNGDEIISNADRSLIKSLDELPFPAWHQIDISNYFDAAKLYPFITLIGGRGCPHSCTFCVLPQVFYGKKYRLRSAKKVVDEIEYDLKLFPDLKEIMFEDDTLTVDKKRTREICNEILNRGIDISWSANVRADLNDLELLKLMKKSGCRMFVTGFEFGDQQILNNVKKNLTIEQMKEFARLTKKARIMVHGCFMIGGPGETRESAKKTLQLIKQLKLNTIQIQGVTPYPGTELYDWCKDNGYIIAKDWTEWVDGGEQSTVVAYPNLSREEIVDFIDRGLYENFYFRPSTWVHHLLTIKDYDDFKRKVRGARSLIGYWREKKRNV